MTTGHVINLVTSDVERFVQFGIMSHYLILAPIQLGAVVYLTYDQVGVAAFFGIGILIAMLPLNLKSATWFEKLRISASKSTDARVNVMSEILGGMRVLKMYAWERPFVGVINKLRATEIGFVTRTNIMFGLILAFYFASTAITTFFSFLAYELLDNELTAEKVKG